MARRKARGNGLMPSTSMQIAVGLSQADIAYRVARSQAARGVGTSYAAQHSVNASTAILCYVFTIAPIMFLALVAPSGSSATAVWRLGTLGIGTLILVRLRRWVKEPASNKLSYKIPTWSLVVFGGIAVWVGLIYLFLSSLL